MADLFPLRWLQDFRPCRLSIPRRITSPAPTLLIRGADTRKPFSRVADLLLTTLSDARLEEVPGAGHTSPLTHADAEEVNRLIMGHIDACRRASAMDDCPAA